MTEVVDRRPEDVGEILVKVQEDLQHLRDELLQKSLAGGTRELVNIQLLENAIQKAEDGIKEQSEKILNVVNNRVTTLPSVDSKVKIQEPSFTQEAIWDISTVNDSNKYGRSERKLNRLAAIEPSTGGGPFGPSPGQQSKYNLNMKLLSDPTNSQNRKAINENYSVSLPVIVDKRKHKPPTQKVVIGSTIDHLAVLPKANRVDPQLLPPAITEKDAKKGILSLMERGLIPPAAELTLDPSPVRQRLVTLHDPQEKKETKAGSGPFGDGMYNLAAVKLDSDILNASRDQISPARGNANTPKTLQTGPSDENMTWASPRSRGHSAKSNKSQDMVAVSVKALEPLPPPTTPASEFKHLSHRFVVQHGRVRDHTKDYLGFKQHYCLSWGNIVTMLKYLQKLLTNYAIPIAFINGDKLADLAIEYELNRPPSKDVLLSVCMNIDDVSTIMNQPGRRYLAPDGKHMAVCKIQATWRRHKDRTAYLEYRRKKWAAGVIAISWVMNVKMSKVKQQLKISRKNQLDAFRRRAKTLQKSWDRIQQSRRVLIHLPSLGYSQKIRSTIGDFNIQQNQQMARLCDLQDPNVEVIYISPVTLNDETLQYYNKLLGLRDAVASGNVDDQKDMVSRFKIIVPEAVNSFPTHSMCLATFLKYSPRAIERIKNLIIGKEAYLVPGVMHKDDLSVADILDVPILGSEPEVSHLYSTKSGSKRIFTSAKVDIPPSDYDVYSMQQLHESLAQLVTENLNVKRYLFKLDDEIDGRGIAYCDVTPNLRCHAWAKKEEIRYGEKWEKKWAQEPAFIKIHAEMPDILAQHATPVNKKLFPTWEKFLEAFLSQGGVIEACPPSDSVTSLTVNMLIEPNGRMSIISSGDQIHADSPFNCWGLSVPQSSVDAKPLNEACIKVAKCCRQRGVLGYFAIDFVTFIDPATQEQKLWAVDLNLWYDDSVSMTKLMLYVTGGTLDTENYVFNVPPVKKEKKKSNHRRKFEYIEPEEPPNTARYAVMSTRLLHTNLTVIHYSVFFQMCRAHGIGYDIKEKQGTVFTLIDSFKREGIGMLAIGEQLQGVLANFARNLSVIHQEISAPNMQGQTNFKYVITDIEGILGTTIQNMDKANEKEDETK
ncbi:IQ domain-containing protein H-like [Lytechinus variegatus]|uniref:IQ domain-containing protein H-like n=1 Tax=Lytechinus variegatus TaxID=7654 RepID=UPI001BB1AB41|nr:IQ domain-containing protein H-like [Lytechinus variegatus]